MTQMNTPSLTEPPRHDDPLATAALAARGAAAADHLEIVDALYRFAAGQDLGDADLFGSAFAADAELDFTQPAKRLGVDLPVMRGRQAIVDAIIPVVARLDTSHTVTNPRVEVQGDRARLWALVEAQHLPKGDERRHLLLKNDYRLELVRSDGAWRIVRMEIHNIWKQGDARVLFP